jgi:hypothetical protein
MIDSGMTSHQHTARASQKLSSPVGRLLSSFLRSCRGCSIPAPLAAQRGPAGCLSPPQHQGRGACCLDLWTLLPSWQCRCRCARLRMALPGQRRGAESCKAPQVSRSDDVMYASKMRRCCKAMAFQATAADRGLCLECAPNDLHLDHWTWTHLLPVSDGG